MEGFNDNVLWTRQRDNSGRPFFNTETLTGVMPIASASSLTLIFLLASITSRFTRMAISDHRCQFITLFDGLHQQRAHHHHQQFERRDQ